MNRPTSRRQFLRSFFVGGAVGVTLSEWTTPMIRAEDSLKKAPDGLLMSEAAWAHFDEQMATRESSRKALAAEADNWLKAEPVNIVTGKKHLGASGDPHDYVSIAVYSWPNPAKPDGLPWITRDGQPNPVFYEYDSQKFETLCLAVSRLILQARVSKDVTYAQAAGRWLRGWFLDPATRMNPHLNFAQFIPGVSKGRGIGIIDTTTLIFLLDYVRHLEFNESWTPDDLNGLRAWVSAYLDWLLTSPNGKTEAKAHNNHGSWYGAQVVSYALFCGRLDVARPQIEETRKRIAAHIEPDGKQPKELARTLALTYTTYNLLALACVAQLARGFDIDLWGWHTEDGRSLLTALKWVMPFYQGKPWKRPQIEPFDLASAAPLLTLAWQGTGDDLYRKTSDQVIHEPWQAITFSKAGLSGRQKPGAAAGENES